jgi:5-methylcytosine-specific restriction endonuclease McrA
MRRSRKPIWAKRAEVKAAGDLTPEQWDAICRFYEDCCAWCELRRATQQDHVRPISRGGAHTAANVVPACEFCNYAKGSSTRWALKRRHPFMEPAVEPMEVER